MKSINPTRELEEVYMGEDRNFLLTQALNYMQQASPHSKGTILRTADLDFWEQGVTRRVAYYGRGHSCPSCS